MVYNEFGYNEIPEGSISLWYVLFEQIAMGPIPYMLELAAFISFGCQTWSVAVIVCMSILINGLINFTERLGSIASMVIININ